MKKRIRYKRRKGIKYKIFPWGVRTKDFEKTLKDVEKFVNKPTVDVISVTTFSFGIIVWYATLVGGVFKVSSREISP